MTDKNERQDVSLAMVHARSNPRPPGTPPSYDRCDFVIGELKEGNIQRCKMLPGHPGDHRYE